MYMYIRVVYILFLIVVIVVNLVLEFFLIVIFLLFVVRIFYCSSYNYFVVMYIGIIVRNVLWNFGFFGIFVVCFSFGFVVVMELIEMEIKIVVILFGSVKVNVSK